MISSGTKTLTKTVKQFICMIFGAMSFYLLEWTNLYTRWYHVNESHISWLTKIAACVYGLVFLALAFLAQYLGGLLQSALTIFGAVGGPLLGVFTLGMFTTFANEFGASFALISGMALTLWMSFGGPRPTPTKLPLSVESCTHNITLTPPSQTDPSHYFYLYRISYMWTSPIGFVWVMLIGSLVSLAVRCPQPWQRAGKDRPDPALFTPPLAARLRAADHKKADIQCELLTKTDFQD